MGLYNEFLPNSWETRVFERVPSIVPLRGGRTNMIALDIGSKRNPVAALAILRDITRTNSSLNGRMVERPVLRMDLEPDGVTQYGMSFSVGLLPRAIELTHRMFPEGRAQGVLGSGDCCWGVGFACCVWEVRWYSATRPDGNRARRVPAASEGILGDVSHHP